jgi:hypothetical protein
LITGSVYTSIKTQQVIEQFTPIVKQAIHLLINGRINDRLKSALTRENTEEKNLPADNDTDQPKGSEIITTQEEIDGFYIVRAILHEVVDVVRVAHRDNKSYFGILLDDNNRRPLCRLHFNTVQKYVGLFDANKTETRHPIQSLNEIYNYAGKLKETVGYYSQTAE